MKKYMAVLALSVISATAGAQTPRSALSLAIGPSIPLGKYASTDQTQPQAGYAKTGFSASLAYSHPIGKISFEAMAYGQQNLMDRNAYTSQLAETNFGFNGGVNYYGNWHMARAYWQLASVMAGVSGEWPVGGIRSRVLRRKDIECVWLE